MKSIKATISVSVVILICYVNHAFSTPTLRIGNADIIAGGETRLNITLENGNQSYAGINIQMVLPIGFSVKNVQKGNLLSSNFLLHWREFAHDATTYLTIIAYSGADQISEPEGILASIVLISDSTVCAGKIPVSFSEHQSNSKVNVHHALSNAGGSLSVAHDIVSGFIRVDGFIFGDLNADEMVNLNDVVLALKVLCGLDADSLDNAGNFENKAIGLEEAIFIFKRSSKMIVNCQ
jgi:hypothetical protein